MLSQIKELFQEALIADRVSRARPLEPGTCMSVICCIVTLDVGLSSPLLP